MLGTEVNREKVARLEKPMHIFLRGGEQSKQRDPNKWQLTSSSGGEERRKSDILT